MIIRVAKENYYCVFNRKITTIFSAGPAEFVWPSHGAVCGGGRD